MSLAYDMLRLPHVPRPLRAAGLLMLVLLALPYAIAPFYAFGEPVSTVMLWRRMTGERVERVYVPLSRISPNLPLAVIVAEDGRFCSHYGVDFAEIRDAINHADDLEDMRGGSTITQQVAKNLFLWPGRSYRAQGAGIPAGAVDRSGAVEAAHPGNLSQHRRMGPERRIRGRGGRPPRLRQARPAICRATRRRCWRRMLPNPHDRDARQPGPGPAPARRALCRPLGAAPRREAVAA